MLELIEIGYSKKPHGKEGYLKINVEEAYVESLLQSRALFFDLDGSPVPFLIEDLDQKSDIIIKLDDIDNPQDASLLTKRTIFLDATEVNISEMTKAVARHERLLGFKVLNSENNAVGHIDSFEEYPSQLMASLITPSGTFLIPFHEDWIITIDYNNKSISLDLPEGLIS